MKRILWELMVAVLAWAAIVMVALGFLHALGVWSVR